MLHGQLVGVGERIVTHVPGDGLRAEPLGDQSVMQPGALGELGSCGWAGPGQGPVEPEPVANDGHRGAGGTGEVDEDAAGERLDGRCVDGSNCGCHGSER